jgi:hypothetical protein
MRPNVGLINGYKLNRRDPWHRVAIGRLYNRFARMLFGVHIRDVDCDFRLIRRDALKHADLRSTSGTICVELVRMMLDLASQICSKPSRSDVRSSEAINCDASSVDPRK